MTSDRPAVNSVATIHLPNPLPSAITRPREHVDAVLTQSLLETGDQEIRAALPRLVPWARDLDYEGPRSR
jgi:hypothetical protein